MVSNVCNNPFNLENIQLLLTQPVIQKMFGDDSKYIKEKNNNFAPRKKLILDVVLCYRNSNPAVLLIIVIQIVSKG